MIIMIKLCFRVHLWVEYISVGKAFKLVDYRKALVDEHTWLARRQAMNMVSHDLGHCSV